jgi:hypothetical protein
MPDILRSTLITLAISVLVGTLFFFSTGDFITPFAITTASQFVVFFMWNSAMGIWAEHLRRQTDNEMYKEFTKMGRDTACSFCGELAYVPINLDEDNRYTCKKCEKVNRIVITLRSVQTTEPTTTTSQDALKKAQDEQPK